VFAVDLGVLEVSIPGVHPQMEPEIGQSLHTVGLPVLSIVNLVVQHTVSLLVLLGVCLAAQYVACLAVLLEVGVARVHLCQGVCPEVRSAVDPKVQSKIILVVLHEVDLSLQLGVDREVQMEPEIGQSLHTVGLPVLNEVNLVVQHIVNLVVQHTVSLLVLLGVCLAAQYVAHLAVLLEVGVARVHLCQGVCPEVRSAVDPKVQSEIILVVLHEVDLSLQLGVDREVQLGVVPVVMHRADLAVLPEVDHVVGQ